MSPKMTRSPMIVATSLVALFAFAASLPSEAAAVVIAGWYAPSGAEPIAADEVFLGVTATTTNGQRLQGSTPTDGTYGTTVPTPAADTGSNNGVRIRSGAGNLMDLTITNNSANDLVLEGFSFDIARISIGGYGSSIRLDYLSGDLAQAPGVIATQAGLGTLPLHSVSRDSYDLSLASLTDQILEVGETAVFRFGGGSTGVSTLIDNFAFLGSVVPSASGTAPEPSTFILATLSLLSLAMTRRRRRR